MAKQSFLYRWLMVFSLRARLGLGLLLTLTLIALSLLIGLRYINILEELNQESNNFYQPVYQKLSKITINLDESYLIMQQVSLSAKTPDEIKLEQIRLRNLHQKELKPNLQALRQNFQQYKIKEIKDLQRNLVENLQYFLKLSQSAEEILVKGKRLPYRQPNSRDSLLYLNSSLETLLQNEIQPLRLEIKQLSEELLDKLSIAVNSREIRLKDQQNIFWWATVGLLSLTLLSMLWAVYSLRYYLLKDLKLIKTYTETLRKGEIPDKIQNYSAEFTTVSKSLNALIHEWRNLQDLTHKIGDNDLDADIRLFNNKGELGQAIAHMQNGLQKISQENATRLWMNSNIAKYSDILGQARSDINKMSEQIIEQLVEDLKVNQGGFFVVEQGKEDKVPHLYLKAAYAYNKKKYLENKIAFGQGLLGQTWQEKSSVYMTDIPPDYINITSGLGDATPSALLIVPLKVGQEVQGLIELASFQDIAAHKREFMERIAERIGSSIATINNTLKTQKLLHDSQSLTQNLQVKEEQMRESMRELRKTQQLMNTTQKELAQKEANLEALINNTSHAIIAFDKNFNITVVNKAMRKLYLENGIQLEVGKNFLEEIPAEDVEKHQREYQRALSGEKFVILRSSDKQNNSTFHELHYNPIRDEQDDVIGASIFIENITKRKQAEVKLQQAEANMSSLINDTADSIVAINQDYQLLVINDTFKNTFAKKGISLKEGDNILDFMDEKARKRWLPLYERALKGERFLKVLSKGVYPDKQYTEHWFNPIHNAEGAVTGFSIFARDVTESKQAEAKIRQLLLESLESTENLKLQEEAMQQKIDAYEQKIRALETQIHS